MPPRNRVFADPGGVTEGGNAAGATWRAGICWNLQTHGMKLEHATSDSTAAGPSDVSASTRLAWRVCRTRNPGLLMRRFDSQERVKPDVCGELSPNFLLQFLNLFVTFLLEIATFNILNIIQPTR